MELWTLMNVFTPGHNQSISTSWFMDGGISVVAKELFHSYRVEVPHKDPFLERPDVGVQEVEPLGLEADLVHVDIARRHVLVAALQTAVLRRNSFVNHFCFARQSSSGTILCRKSESTSPILLVLMTKLEELDLSKPKP